MKEDDIMRTLFGMILGCLLTIAFLYVHDSMAASTGASTATASTSRAIVNWDVATSDWGQFKDGVGAIWLKLRAGANG